MKKKLVRQVKFLAGILPEIDETSARTVTISGDDANLCVVGGSPYDPKKKYEFENPVFERINHEKRLKKGIKRYGQGFVGEYVTAIGNGTHL